MATITDYRHNDMFSFEFPTHIIFEIGGLGRIQEYLSNTGKSKALIVLSESTLERNPSIKEITGITKKGISITPYILKKDFKASTEELYKILNHLKNNNYDAIISVGGGNIVDFTKVAALCLDENVDISTVVGKTINYSEKKLFHIAIPTTFGTGSEVTKGAIILDTQRNIKDGVRGNAIFPDLAIIDPSLGMTMPDNVLRETIFDSFTHSFEALHATKRNPITRLLALESLKIFNRNLERYVKKELDEKFFYDAALVSLFGGVCICHSSTCLPHRFEQAFSPLYHLSHGSGLAAIYPTWVKELENNECIDPVFEQITQGITASEYVNHIIEKLNLTNSAKHLKETRLSPTEVTKRITGNVQNDPLVNIQGGKIVISLFDKIMRDL